MEGTKLPLLLPTLEADERLVLGGELQNIQTTFLLLIYESYIALDVCFGTAPTRTLHKGYDSGQLY